MSLRIVAVVVLAGGVLTSSPAGAQNNKTDELMAKTAAYVAQFVDQFSNVVAEETLLQETTIPRRKRTIRSDFLLVRYPGDAQWYAFRDVGEVDGKPVRDKEERLTKLFLEPAASAIRRARELQEAGSRYNLLDIGTLNNPVLTMAFLQPDYRPRFRWNLAGIDKDLGPTIRTVRFEEFRIPSILKMGANQDMLSRGLIWVDEETGRVVKTRLQAGPFRTPPEIVTTFRREESLGIDVPAEMKDWYPDNNGEVRGVATYSRFRRFAVQTDEAIAKP